MAAQCALARALDHDRGIVFHGIDPEKKLILMRGAGGSRMTRKY
jgi:hypothetical protein